MVMRLAAALGIGRVRFVVIVEDLHIAALIIAAEYVAGVAIRALPQRIEEAVLVVYAAVLSWAEHEAKPLGPRAKCLASFFGCDRGKDDRGDYDCYDYDNYHYLCQNKLPSLSVAGSGWEI